MSDLDALTTAITAEHAAIYAYGVVAAYAAPQRADDIAAFVAGHRARRDSLARAIQDGGAVVPEAAAGYEIDPSPTDPASAATLAVTAESECCDAYAVAMGTAETEPVRRQASDGLSECFARQARWLRWTGQPLPDLP